MSGTGTPYERESAPAAVTSLPNRAKVSGVGSSASNSSPLGKIQVSANVRVAIMASAWAHSGARNVRASMAAPAIRPTAMMQSISQVHSSKIEESGAAASSVAPAATRPSRRRPVTGTTRRRASSWP